MSEAVPKARVSSVHCLVDAQIVHGTTHNVHGLQALPSSPLGALVDAWIVHGGGALGGHK